MSVDRNGRNGTGFVRVSERASIAPGEAVTATVGRYDVAIFNAEGAFYAYENVCPHQGGPIGEGEIDGAFVTCPWHAWCFDLRTGKLALGDFAELRRFELRIDGDAIFVAAEPSFDPSTTLRAGSAQDDDGG